MAQDNNELYKFINHKSIHEGLADLKQFVANHPVLHLDERLKDVESDFRLMADFMLKGYKDERRTQLYRELLHRLYVIAYDTELDLKTKTDPLYIAARARSQRLDFSHDAVQNQLETFVQDVAMLSLENADSRADKEHYLYLQHHQYTSSLFDAILVSPHWKENDAQFFSSLIVSPTIDALDAQLIVSAITLSLTARYDINRLCTLVTVYRQSKDEFVRQRALVGFALNMHSPEDDGSQKEMLREVLKDETARRELLELQMQVFYCNDTDSDNAKINKEIIPNLMKGNNFTITKFGILEKEDDPMEDILNPGAADKAMEEMEQSMRKIYDMQKAGSDVYFGGFSHMKRFAFFYTLSNWFVPFYIEHPELSKVRQELKGNKFLDLLFSGGPFCDSDKYSFALAMSGVMERLPANVKEMMNSAEAFGPVMNPEEMMKPAYIRRMYLQDLYRFFRLFQQKNAFPNPFDMQQDNRALFLQNADLDYPPFYPCILELCQFLLKRKEGARVEAVLNVYNMPASTERDMLYACSFMTQEYYAAAVNALKQVLNASPDNEKALKLYGQCCFHLEDYEEALRAYDKLTGINPDSFSYRLSAAITRINIAEEENLQQGVDELYKLDYEHPDNRNVIRALGWGLLEQQKPEQAEKMYAKLLEADRPQPQDYLHAACCKWMLNQVDKAASLLGKFKETAASDFLRGLQGVKSLLVRNGISETDITIMVDLLQA